MAAINLLQEHLRVTDGIPDHTDQCGLLGGGWGGGGSHFIEEKHKITCSRFQGDKQHTRDSPAEVEAASTSVPLSNNMMLTQQQQLSRQSDCCWCHIFKGNQSASV